MALAALKPATIEDWLAFDDGTDTRYELVGGRLIAMAPTRPRHGRIDANIVQIMIDAVPDDDLCQAVIGAGITVEVDGDRRGYIVDVAQTCEEVADVTSLQAPRLLVEILSPSTQGYDKRRKVPDYATLPSVEEIWLVDSRERSVLVWRRVDGDWNESPAYTGSEIFRSRALSVEVALDRIYRTTGL